MSIPQGEEKRHQIMNQPINDESTTTGIMEAVGNTPLVQLSRYLENSAVQLYAKLEFCNPGGSAKDRPAYEMIKAGLETGQIDATSTIVESSSGNMGIGLAQACGYFGLKLICVVDPRAQAQNIRIMQALGAEVQMVEKPVDGDFLQARLNRVCWLLENIEGSYWPNQYANPGNPRSHELGTIREIDEELNGKFDYLFVATSSTGTARGCQDYLRRHGRRTQVVAVDAVGSVLFGGEPGPRHIPGLGTGRIPKLARGQRFDVIHRVSDLNCVVECRRLAKREAILAGGSAGGVLSTIRAMQEQLTGKSCVAILHDSGTRYLDTVFNDVWVESKLGCSSQELQRLIGSSTPVNEGVENQCQVLA